MSDDMPDAVDLVLARIEETYGEAGPEGKFRTYYNGEPEVIPMFNLPCVIVTQLRDDTEEAEMGEDDVTDQIRIKLVMNKKEDYSGTIDPLNLTEKRLRDLVGRRNAQNQYKDGTIKRMLRDALLEGVTAVAPTMAVEYGVNPRDTLGDSDNVAWTAEAWVTFSIQYSVETYQ